MRPWLVASTLSVLFAACTPPEADTGKDSGSAPEGEQDADGDGVSSDVDCNDQDPLILPGATEVCDEKDNNCDGFVDEGVTTVFYRDADQDSFGDATAAEEGCAAPEGYVNDTTDCDDTDGDISPAAAESCNAVDDDCDGSTDEGVETTYYLDADVDGFGTPDTTTTGCEVPDGYSANDSDCDDAHSSVHFGASEVCDGLDNNCDGATDEGLLVTYFHDLDLDGYGAPEDSTTACTLPSGYVANDEDCDDAHSTVHYGATETCDDLDNNCDGDVDEGVLATWYEDADGDTYGGTSSTSACAAPEGHVDNSDDCDDAEPSAHPGAAETCNTSDDDCDGEIDEGVELAWYLDADADGFGGTTMTEACTAPSGYVADSTDCDDAEGTIYPGATEILCDGIVESCGGSDGDMTVSASMDLQSKLDEAVAGAIVCVEAGRYYAPLQIDKALTIIAMEGADETFIVGDTTDRAISISAANTTVRGFTITGGYCGDEIGGGVYINDANNAIVEECIVTDNSCDGDSGEGGGIGIENSSGVQILDNTIEANSAAYGGGISILDTAIEVVISGNNLDGNVADMYGGGLYISDSVRPSVQDNTFNENEAGVWGGGLYTYAADGASVEGNTITANYSGWAGGGMLINANADIVVQDNNFEENSAYLAGGAITLYSSDRTSIGANSLVANTAEEAGGGIFVLWSDDVSLEGISFDSNTVPDGDYGWGGGLYVEGSASLLVTDCDFTSNSAEAGGAVFLNGSYDGDRYYILVADSTSLITTEATVSDNTFTSNSASDAGGAVLSLFGDSDTYDHNGYYSNSAADGGALYWYQQASATTTGNIFDTNVASHYGGGAYLDGAVLFLQDEEYRTNAASNGGGIYCASGSTYTSDTGTNFSGNTPNASDGC